LFPDGGGFETASEKQRDVVGFFYSLGIGNKTNGEFWNAPQDAFKE